LSKESKLERLRLLKETITKYKQDYGLTKEDFLSLYDEKEYVPVSIFSHSIGPLEALVKYLKEDKKLKYSQIAKLLKRDQRTIWVTYNDAIKNLKSKLNKKSLEKIPISIFSNRRIGVLEHVVLYLKDVKKISVSDISTLLNRKNSTIWATYYNARGKNKT